jgi:chemotaxis signal transduction protein
VSDATSPSANNGKAVPVAAENGHPAEPADLSGTMTLQPVDLDALLMRISERLITLDDTGLMPHQADEPLERVQYLLFRAGETYFGVEVHYVGEVVQHPAITHVPGLPRWIHGVTNLHGNIISVVDLGHFLGLPSSLLSPVMFLARAGDQQIGLIVDEVETIYIFPAAQIFSPTFRVAEELVPYLHGAVDRDGHIIRLIDCERLLLSQQMQQFA